MKGVKKASDPNLGSPLTPAPPSGIDDHSSSLCQENIVEGFPTPKAGTPKIPGRLPINTNEQLPTRVEPSTTVGDDIDADVLIQLTNNLNKAISQRDINAFQYILHLLCDKFFISIIRELCDHGMTYFDSKVGPVMIQGLDYHSFKFTTG